MRGRSLTRTRECLMTTNNGYFGFSIAADAKLVAAALAFERKLGINEMNRIQSRVWTTFPDAELNEVLIDARNFLFPLP